jgi:amino acid transporter
MWFCGLSCIASASRALYSLARDGGAPFSDTLRRVNPKHNTPGAAIWTIVALSLAAMLWTGAIPIVTSLSTVALYAAYIIPIALKFFSAPAAGSTPAASPLIGTLGSAPPWNLGRYSRLCNATAITYTVVVCIVLVMPPNTLAGVTFAALLAALTLLWFAWARRVFKAPAWSTANK